MLRSKELIFESLSLDDITKKLSKHFGQKPNIAYNSRQDFINFFNHSRTMLKELGSWTNPALDLICTNIRITNGSDIKSITCKINGERYLYISNNESIINFPHIFILPCYDARTEITYQFEFLENAKKEVCWLMDIIEIPIWFRRLFSIIPYHVNFSDKFLLSHYQQSNHEYMLRTHVSDCPGSYKISSTYKLEISDPTRYSLTVWVKNESDIDKLLKEDFILSVKELNEIEPKKCGDFYRYNFIVKNNGLNRLYRLKYIIGFQIDDLPISSDYSIYQEYIDNIAEISVKSMKWLSLDSLEPHDTFETLYKKYNEGKDMEQLLRKELDNLLTSSIENCKYPEPFIEARINESKIITVFISGGIVFYTNPLQYTVCVIFEDKHVEYIRGSADNLIFLKKYMNSENRKRIFSE